LAEGNKAFVKFKNEESSSEDNERWQKAAEKQKAEEENNSSRSEDDVKFVDFPALSEEIIRVIGDYGAVFPKLNQKAPVVWKHVLYLSQQVGRLVDELERQEQMLSPRPGTTIQFW
jgi:hypothetical protein